DPGKVNAELLRKPADLPQMLYIAMGVETCLARTSTRLNQAFAFVETQRLRMHVNQLRSYADDVERLVLVDAFTLLFLLELIVSHLPLHPTRTFRVRLARAHAEDRV